MSTGTLTSGTVVSRIETLLLIAIGGFAGSNFRYLAGYIVPGLVGTLIANLCGAFALGFVLEGGYSLDTLSEGVNMVHEVFDGFQPTAPDGEVSADVRELLADVRAAHGLGSK